MNVLFFSFIGTLTEEEALFCLRLSVLFSVFMVTSFSEFVMLLASAGKESLWFRVPGIVLGAMISVFSFSPHLIFGVSPAFEFAFWPEPGFLFYWFEVWLVLSFTIAFAFLARATLSVRQTMPRRRLVMALTSGVVGFLGIFLHYWSWVPSVGIPPIGNPLISVFVLMAAYAVLKHKLMIVETAIRKTLIFATLFTFVYGIFALAAFFIQELFSSYFIEARVWATLVSVLFVMICYEPLKRFLTDLTDRFLFQRKFNYQKLLRDASAGIAQVKSLDQLSSLVLHFITMRMRLRNAGILARTVGTDRFHLAYRRGYDSPPFLESIDASDPLILFLQEEREPIDIDSVQEWVEVKSRGEAIGRKMKHDYDYKVIQNRMAILKAASCIPSFLGRELRNVLILGEKKSGDYFTQEDLNVLFTLAEESAIAIENARLYDEALSKSKELSRINHELEAAQGNLIRALNDTELANKRLQDTQAQLIHEQKMATLGRLASSVGHEVNNPLTILSMNVSRAILKYRKDPNLRVADILDIFEKMEQNIGRIKAVVNTLTGLLKKSEKGKFEPLSLKLILEETLPLVQFQTYLDNLSGTEVQFDIPGNIPLVRGDLERLQEVFLNLFINAYHAMSGKRDRKITVTARPSESNPKMVAIEFNDNGSGMSEDVMKKVFTYGFTTKPVGKGSGMGLYMCRYIIELHGGEIKVHSKIGEGTTFVLSLPIYEEESSLTSPGPFSGRQPSEHSDEI